LFYDVKFSVIERFNIDWKWFFHFHFDRKRKFNALFSNFWIWIYSIIVVYESSKIDYRLKWVLISFSWIKSHVK
jgi:hypothetical protein